MLFLEIRWDVIGKTWMDHHNVSEDNMKENYHSLHTPYYICMIEYVFLVLMSENDFYSSERTMAGK